MKVVFVNWTLPHIQSTSKKYEMNDFELLANKVAIVNAIKYTKLPIKLYTDDIGYKFYKHHHLIHLFDEVDTKTLNDYNKKDINAIGYYTSGKTVALVKERGPFIFIDNDFILKSRIPEWIYNYDLVCTHWEINRGEFFINSDDIKDLGIDFYENMMCPNTSFIFMNNQALQQRYLLNHNKIIENIKNPSKPIWLLSDQAVLGYSARKLDLDVASLEDKAYIIYSEHEKSKNEVGYLPNWVDVGLNKHKDKLDYWHIWWWKSIIKKNDELKKQTVSELLNILDEKTII